MEKVFYKREIDTTHFIRFFADGTVITASVNDFWLKPIEETWHLVSKWFTADYQEARGKYSFFSDQILFFSQAKNGAVIYNGTLNTDKTIMLLKNHSHINGNRSPSEHYSLLEVD